MSCTLRVSPHEEMNATLKRWNEIMNLLMNEKATSRERRGLRSFEVLKREKLKAKLKETRQGEAEAIKTARKNLYSPLDHFLLYLNEEWDMAFETYQVLEFIFRAAMASHERDLFDYGSQNYAEALSGVRGTPQERYNQIHSLVEKFSKKSFFGLDDVYPTKMDYVNDVNRELEDHVAKLRLLQEQINLEDKNSPLYKVAQELQKSAKGLEDWAFGRILGREQNRKFLSFQDGRVLMDHKNFLYFKIYILVFMGTFGEFAHRVFPERSNLICQLAEKKLKFESQKHFDFKITPRFLSGRERFADQDRPAENLPAERGFLDADLLNYIVEKNNDLLENGELPFHLVKRLKNKKSA